MPGRCRSLPRDRGTRQRHAPGYSFTSAQQWPGRESRPRRTRAFFSAAGGHAPSLPVNQLPRQEADGWVPAQTAPDGRVFICRPQERVVRTRKCLTQTMTGARVTAAEANGQRSVIGVVQGCGKQRMRSVFFVCRTILTSAVIILNKTSAEFYLPFHLSGVFSGFTCPRTSNDSHVYGDEIIGCNYPRVAVGPFICVHGVIRKYRLRVPLHG